MTDKDRIIAAIAQAVEPLVEQVRDYQDVVNRLLTIIEQHDARIERLEFHVLKIQPAPPMKTARHDH